MMYGNSSMGYAYSPDNSKNVNHSNLNSQFLGASGSRQGGYCFSASNKKESNGTWKQSGSGAWYKD